MSTDPVDASSSSAASWQADLEPAFFEPLFASAPEGGREALVHSINKSAVEESILLTGTISDVHHRSNTFWIRPNPVHRCSKTHLFSRLEHVRNGNVSVWDLLGREVASFRLVAGEAKDTFEAIDVVLAENLHQEDDEEEILFQPARFSDREWLLLGAASEVEKQAAEQQASEQDDAEEVQSEDSLVAEQQHPEHSVGQRRSSCFGQIQVRPARCTSYIGAHPTFGPGIFAHNQNAAPSSFAFPQEPQPFQCTRCGKVLTTQKALEMHSRSHAHTRVAVAASSASNVADFQRPDTRQSPHQMRIPMRFALPSRFRRRFQCHLCARYLNSQKQLDEHLASKAHLGTPSAATAIHNSVQVPRKEEHKPNQEIHVPLEADLLYSHDPWAKSLTSSGRDLLLPATGLDHPERQTFTSKCTGQSAPDASSIDQSSASSTSSTWEACQLSVEHEPLQPATVQQFYTTVLGLADVEVTASSCDVRPAFASRAATGYNFDRGNVIPSADILAMRSLTLRPSELNHLQLRPASQNSGCSLPDPGLSTPMSWEACQSPIEDEQSHVSTGPHAAEDKGYLESDASMVADVGQAKNNDQWAAFVGSNSTASPLQTAAAQSVRPLPCSTPNALRLPGFSHWDPYNSCRVVHASDLAPQPKLLSDDSPENKHYGVLKAGNLNYIAQLSESALNEIKARSEHVLSGDKWTHNTLRNFLRYRYIRLLEQGRVLHIFALSVQCRTCQVMSAQGYSQHVILFHTGLVDVKGEPIFAVMVQDLPNRGRYKLLRSGIHSMENGKLPEWWCSLLRSPEVQVNGPAYRRLQVIDSLMNASYFQGRDQRLLFDPDLEVRLNSNHIVEQNLDRLIMGGVDVDEAVFRDRAESDLPDERNWRFLCYRGRKIRELRYDEENYKSFVFTRRNLGKKSVETLVKRWHQESVHATRFDFKLALPQFYYSLVTVDPRLQVYVGRLQLLLPLFCDGSTPKLALSIQYEEGPSPYYFSATVLTLSMANNNARQISTPQVPWIRSSAEEDSVEEDGF
jgi:hypothetical protein